MQQSNQGEFRIIPIKGIVKNYQQHRSHYDEGKISELASSIKEKGVLEPILVRPFSAAGPDAGEIFEIVAGQRRWMASKEAGLEAMPCIVREMDDDEAFEISVIENLQREDVHPLDEAYAIARMQERGMDIKEIALRMGKSESYIYQRIKISQLVDPLKKAFFEGRFGIGHAVEICKLTDYDQQELYKELYKSEPWGGYPTLSNLMAYIDREFVLDLKKTLFKMDDAELFQDAGPCTTCVKRSGANPTLFGNLDNKDMCFDRGCFKIKSDLAMNDLIEKAKLKDSLFLFNRYDNVDKNLVKELKSLGYQVLCHWDDFGMASDAKYSDEGILRGFWISGTDRGKYEKVRLKSSAENASQSGQDIDTPESQIVKIKMREARAVELDREKVQQAMIDLLDGEYEQENFIRNTSLLRFLAFALWQTGLHWEFDNKLEEAAKKIINHQDSWEAKRIAVTRLLLTEGELWIHDMLKAWFKNKCTSSSNLDYDRSPEPMAYREFAKLIIPSMLEGLNVAQDEVAKKRKEKVEKRIAKLQEAESL